MSKPLISQSSAPLIAEIDVVDERGRHSSINIPAERPLTVYLDKRELVTLMTMGGWPEALVLGYLRNQRLVRSLDEIASVQVDWEVESAAVTTHGGVDRIEERTAKKVVTTGCGQGTVFGGLMDEIESVMLPPDARISQQVIYRIVDAIRNQSSIYKQAGSVHACALFSRQGELIYFIEDIGRHNAVDAIAGSMWLDGMDGGDKIFYTTGRLTSEMVIKGAQMGIPFLMSRSGTTQMGHAVASQVGATLIGRCSGRHFLALAGAARIDFDAELQQA
ncbi:MAG: sulfurtransferase FdhD [Burkholderiaceae bacterium]|nr:sulfurtransferase FdhD [Burkholderiaceae bacterium]